MTNLEKTLLAFKVITSDDELESKNHAYVAIAKMAVEMVQDPDDTISGQLDFIAEEISRVARFLEENPNLEPEPESLEMERICEIIRAAGFPAYVEMTGGGTATIYAGQERENPVTKDPYYPCIVGPGWFQDGRGYLSASDDSCFGTDSYGPTGEDSETSIYFEKGETEQTAAAKVVAFITSAIAKGFYND